MGCVLDVIRKRRSVRAFLPRPVEEEKLLRVLEAARLAPSSMNRQPWKFVVIKDQGIRSKLTTVAKGQRFVGEAPVVIAACTTDPSLRMGCGEPTYAIDLAIAVDHMTLVAVEEGLGTCWIGNFDQKAAGDLLKVTPPARVIFLLPVGYPAKESKERPRKKLEEIVCDETYS